MRLDEIESFPWNRCLSDGSMVFVFKDRGPIVDPCYSILHIKGPGVFTLNESWINVDPITAQAVLYHICGVTQEVTCEAG